MSRAAKLVAKFFLWMIGVAIPVFIAACYGMPYRYSKQGRVIDKVSKQGINALSVSCLRGGTQESQTHTGPQGDFELDYDLPCDTLEVRDVDGADNGAYQDKTVPFCESCPEITVELDQVTP